MLENRWPVNIVQPIAHPVNRETHDRELAISYRQLVFDMILEGRVIGQ